MITFKSHITESLNSSYDVDYITNREDKAYFRFSDENGNIYRVTFLRNESHGEWDIDVEFTASTGVHSPSMDVTGKAFNALKVYATIGNELKRYMRDYPADVIGFSSVATRTIPIYEKLAKRIAAQFQGKLHIFDISSKMKAFKIVL